MTVSLSNYAKFWTRLDLIQQLSIGTVVITTIFGVVYYWMSGGTQHVYAVLALGTMFALASDRIRQYNFEKDVKDGLSSVVSSRAHLHFIGDSNAGIEWIARKSSGPVLIRNTVFLRRNDENFKLDNESISRLESAAKQALRDGCRWHDVFVASQRNVIDAFYNTLTPKERAGYKATEIPANIPLMQITVIRFKDDRGDVLFGFGFGDADTRVFHSDDTNTINYFDAYFREISKAGKVAYP
jgi:hypothetical protein